MGDWIDRLARRASVSQPASPGAGFTRRQGLRTVALGALAVGPAAAVLDRLGGAGSCVRAEATCTARAEEAFVSAVRACKPKRAAGDTWGELRCLVRANARLARTRRECLAADDAACQPGERCDAVTGNCVPASPSAKPSPTPDPVAPYLCAHDMPTAASLLAGRNSLDAGSLDVALSPNGCVRYERTLQSSGDLAFERLTLAGRTVSEVTHTASGSSARADHDDDGFFEWRATLVRGTNPEIDIEFSELDPRSGAVVRREQRTTRDGVIHVLIEQDGAIVNQFDTPAEQDADLARAISEASRRDPGPCSTDRFTRYWNQPTQCMDRTTKCLTDKGRKKLTNELLKLVTKVQIVCDDAPTYGGYARALDASTSPLPRRPRISIPPRFDGLAEHLQKSTLCHEVMHYSSLGLHDPAIPVMRSGELDPVNACEYICADESPLAPPTKCQCATCFGVPPCHPLCAPYRGCEPMGALCPCPQRHRWYPTLTLCLADCPSGLACFGYQKCFAYDAEC